MHTDEYEISIWREIEVCKSAITIAEKKLADMERKHGLRGDAVADQLRSGGAGGDSACSAWLETYRGLMTWKEKLTQYEEFLKSMKQSQ